MAVERTIRIRPARTEDAEAVVGLGVDSVSLDPLPVTVDRVAMRSTFQALVNRPQHFAWVGETDSGVVAAVVACTQQGFWFTRQQCSVLLFFSRVPGAGLPLLREFARWIKTRPAIKLGVVSLEPGVDPRIAMAWKRLGFKRESLNLTYVRQA